MALRGRGGVESVLQSCAASRLQSNSTRASATVFGRASERLQGMKLPVVEKLVENLTLLPKYKKGILCSQGMHMFFGDPKGPTMHFCDLKAAQILLIMI